MILAEKNNLRKRDIVSLYIAMFLLLFELIFTLVAIINCEDIENAIIPILNLIVLSGAMYYGLVGYNKPHGNLLRYIIIVFSIVVMCEALVTSFNICDGWVISPELEAASALISIYIAGRLNKIQKNKWLCILNLVVLLAASILNLRNIGEVTFLTAIPVFAKSVLWFTLMTFYIARYYMHKEAGLEDK